MKLTAKVVASLTLPAGKDDHIAWDDDVAGFGVRLRRKGSRTFVFQFKAAGKQHRIKIGAVSAIDIGRARETARDYYARVRLGENPATSRSEARIKAAETFEALAGRYLAHKRQHLRPRPYLDHEHHVLVHAKKLHPLQIEKITRRDIATVIAEAADIGPVTGNRVRTTLNTFFAWAMTQGLIDANPVVGTLKNPERSRDRVLTPLELRSIWNGLGDDQYGSIIKLLALTGQRAAEISDLRWSEVRENAIHLSAERTKNGRPHTVPLARAAISIIEAQPRRITAAGEPRDLIFGIGAGGFDGWSHAKVRLDERIKLQPWTTHDLRRSFATHAAEIGIAPHIIEAVLNHVSGHRAGTAGIYNRALYDREKRIALDRWADWLMAVVEGRETNVTTLRQQA